MECKPENKFNSLPPFKKQTSMSSLIVWNISRALKNNPYIDLRSAIRAAQERLEHDSHDVDMMTSEYPEEHYLVCAVLAWQQLGHHNADSLCEFIERKKREIYISPTVVNANTTCSFGTDSISIDSCTMGPVVKLPTQTNIVMRMESVPNTRPNKPKAQEKDIMEKIDAACCLDSACIERLKTMDNTTNELRSRAAKLAKRESERVQLLERAEAAWKDLEIGYQRRLGLAEEKEEDMTKQIGRLIEERVGNKNACTVLAKQLKERGDVAEKERVRLTQIEKDVYDRACIRLRLSEEAARGDAVLAEQQCKAAQLDRDLQYKEEQARRKIMSLESEAESARTLTHEVERALRVELGSLREQIAKLSDQLLEEDKDNSLIKVALEELREEKMELVEDLEGCKVMCDNRMQGRLNELNKCREQVNALKDKVMECRCKLPVDESVEVKRTPSLAALCQCSPEDKLMESCSCTSLRSRLLSNLFSDLFGGLQEELGSGNQMPCQLLKCLEDKHNWDRASVVKTNLRNYFSNLLIGELDIAIATAIEKYHAKWVGASCADQAKLIPDPGDAENRRWQQQALELEAQKVATQLAEQLFKERTEQLEKRVKDIVASGPPPCECSPRTAAFTCMVKQNMHVNEGKTAPAYWQRTLQDVTQLRLQIEDLKKESIKKQDLKTMEEHITKMVQRGSGIENVDFAGNTNIQRNCLDNQIKNGFKSFTTNTKHSNNVVKTIKPSFTQKKQLVTAAFKKEKSKNVLQSQMDNNSSKISKRFRQEYAINMCLCNTKNRKQQQKVSQNVIVNNEHKNSWKQKSSKDVISQMSSIKQTKPINTHLPSSELTFLGSNKDSEKDSCLSNCVCFNKIPSNTSIDKILESLARWKGDLEHSNEKIRYPTDQNVKNTTDIINKFSTDYSSVLKKPSKNEKKSPNYNKRLLNESKFSSNDNNQLTINEYEDNNFENILPTTTESEYMGVINLDKSDENFCKCVQDVGDKNSNCSPTNSKGNKKILLKCINSAKCTCKNAQGISKDNMKMVSLNEIQYPKESKLADLQISSKNEPLKEVRLDVIEPSVVLENTLNNSDKTQECLFPCDYCVKFLGITLANANSPKNNFEYFKDIEKIEKCQEMMGDANSVLTLPLPDNTIPETLFKKEHESNMCKILQKMGNEKVSNCDCKTKFEELKDLIRGMLEKKTDESISIQDKSLDTESILLRASTNENCMCCNNNSDLEESKNLEENTFQLIEEHLKEKLDDFKVSFCKSSCMSPNEEEKLFSTLLHRVKEVISNSTKEMICKCSDDEKTNGSWNRAYGLLQEYLRMKLKRAQCSCGSSSKNNEMIPLDNVLERVSLLIKKDFERLKNICNYKNLTKRNLPNVNSPYKNIFINDLPEKDTNDTYNIMSLNYCKINDNDTNIEKQSKQNSNKSIILTQNMSSQVSQYLGMESKSCNGMEKGSKNIQTQDSKYTLFNKNCKTSVCNCSTKQNDDQYLEVLGTNDLCVSHRAEIKINDKILNSEIVFQSIDKNNILHDLDKKSLQDFNVTKYSDTDECVDINCEQQVKIPYVGTTVDCSCDGKICSCVCMKSFVQTNNDKIVSIWKMFTQNTVCAPNVSYIMNSIIDRSEQEKNDIANLMADMYSANFPELHSLQSSTHPLCDIKVNTLHPKEDFVLKSSKENFDQTHVMINTNSENFSSDYSNIDDAVDWYDCKRFDKSQISPNDALKDIIDLEISKDSGKVHTLNNRKSRSLHSETKICYCNTVPVCHIKMLVENIENKLLNAQCTCDSLTPIVCPVHGANTSG